VDISIPLVVVLLLLWGLGFVILFRVPGLCTPVTGINLPSVSVIVPARNEAVNLSGLLSTLRSQRGLRPIETIVVDDESEDSTAGVAAEGGATVVPAGRRPPGWTGKNWACHCGAERARGELLVFLDADTRLSSDGLARLAATWYDGRGVVSVQPWHATVRLYEQFSAFFNLVLVGALGVFSPFRRWVKPVGLFGPCLVIAAEDYQSAGGHVGVRGRVMEDMFLAVTFQRAGLPVRLFGGRGTIEFRMYPAGPGQMVEGWSKGFATGAGRTSILWLVIMVAWITGSIDTLRQLVTASVANEPAATFFWAGLYVAFAAQLFWMLRRLGRFAWYTSLFYPVPLVFFIVVFLRSLYLVVVRRRVRWKGRDITS